MDLEVLGPICCELNECTVVQVVTQLVLCLKVRTSSGTVPKGTDTDVVEVTQLVLCCTSSVWYGLCCMSQHET